MSKYTWVITEDVSPHEPFAKGPVGARHRELSSHVMRRGAHFRMVDASGRPKVSGYILGRFYGHEPLSEYGRNRGCVEIEYAFDGTWIRLKKKQA